MDAPIELVLEDGILIAKEYTYVDSLGEAGVAVRCSDGSWSVHTIKAIPSERDYYGVQLPPRDLPFAEKRELVIEQAGLDPDYLPWVEYDKAGDPLPETDTEERLEAWLDSDVVGDRLETWGGGRTSEHGIALQILDVLSDAERRRLGMRQVDLGGPASSVPAVAMTGSRAQFNWIMRVHRLPFVLVESE